MGNIESKAGMVPVGHASTTSRRRSFRHDPASDRMNSAQLGKLELLVSIHGHVDKKSKRDRLAATSGIPLGDTTRFGIVWKGVDPAREGMRDMDLVSAGQSDEDWSLSSYSGLDLKPDYVLVGAENRIPNPETDAI